MFYTIGEFSKITRVTVKALRHYHALGLLVPDYVDPSSGYRYYMPEQVASAAIITALRRFEFSLGEIGEILANCEDDGDVAAYLARQRGRLQERLRSTRLLITEIETLIQMETQAMANDNTHSTPITEKEIAAQVVAGVRMKGRYEEIGAGFKKLGRALGRHLGGTPFGLYYDDAYREEDADFEACFPLKRTVAPKDPSIDVRELAGGRALTLLHRGPYDSIGQAYRRLFGHAKAAGLTPRTPSREVYLKGPGIFFKGNPVNYLTEVQIPVEAALGGEETRG